jgi:hypothetical protein
MHKLRYEPRAYGGDDGLGSASQEGDTKYGITCDGTRESLNCLSDGEDSGIEAVGK